MQTTSATYATALAADNHTFEIKLNIADPTDPSDPGEDYGMSEIFTLKTDSKIFAETPTIGGAYSATCEFSIIPHSGVTIPRMAKCTPYFRVTDGTNTSEWIQKGVFFIDTRETTNNGANFDVMNVFAYDAMLKANQFYATSNIAWPATDTNIVNEIAGFMGVSVDSRTASVLTSGYTLTAPYEMSTVPTMRDYLSYIGVMYAANWIITDDGKLRLVPIGGGTDTLAVGDNAESVENSPLRPAVSGVVVSVNDDEGADIFAGMDETNVIEAYCPFADNTIVGDIYTTLSAWQYQPFEATNAWSNPAVEVGDQITAGQNTSSTIYSREILFNSGMPMTLSAPNDQDVDHEYTYEDPEERNYRSTVNNIYNLISENEEGVTILSGQIQNLGIRNFIINTKDPDPDVLPQIYEQLSPTYIQNYTPTAAVHGMRFTKDTSTSAAFLFAMGATSASDQYASMNGLYANSTYTLAFDLAYKLLAASSTQAYMRWRLLSWNSGGTLTQTPIGGADNKIPITRNTDITTTFSGTFTVPMSAVSCCIYMDLVTISGGVETAIANSAVRSTDYYELANLRLVQGAVATEWTAAPEDNAGDGSDIVSRINVYPGVITIDADKINLNGAVSANNNVKIKLDGTIEAVNADISGKFTMTDGSIDVTTSSGSNNVIQLNTTQIHNKLSPNGVYLTVDGVTPRPETTLGATGLSVTDSTNTATIATNDISVASSTDGVDLSIANGIKWYGSLGNLFEASKDGSNRCQVKLANDGGKVLTELTADSLLFKDANGATTFTYPASGLGLNDLVGNVSELISTGSTAKTYTLSTNGTYLLTIARANNSATTYDGVWLISRHNTSHLTQIIKGTNAPSPSISGGTLSFTTTSANQRVTITRLS